MLTRLIQITPGKEFTWMTESITIHCAVNTLCFLNEHIGVQNADGIQWFEEKNYLRHYVMVKDKSLCVSGSTDLKGTGFKKGLS
jgi:hypothetical protein